jgi:CheY-like chemotaxis protein
MYEMLSGDRPFAGDDPDAMRDRILTRDPDLTPLPPDLSPEVGTVLRRALTKDPSGRFESGRAILEALNGCRTGALPPATLERAARRRGLRVAAGLVGVLGLASVAVFLVRPNIDAGPVPRIAGSGSVAHVLWVDDNPENNTEIARQIEGRGVQVTTALSTIDAVRRFDPATHEMVVSDMGRFEGPNESYVERAGFDLLSQLRARHPEVQVVFCTSARAARTYRAEALSAGALGIVEDCSAILGLMGI